MRPFIISLLLCLLSGSMALADNKSNCIWVKHADNTSTCIMLDTNPQIIFDGEAVVIGTKSFQLNDVVSYRFGIDTEASIDEITCEDNCIIADGDRITVRNKSIKYGVKIFDTKGSTVKETFPASESDSLTVDISNLRAGVYFLSIDGQSLKFVKR